MVPELLDKATVVPSVNQIELHPYLQNRAAAGFARERGIQPIAEALATVPEAEFVAACDISAERAYIRTENLSCVRHDGSTLEIAIQGSIFGEDGKVGMRGRLVTKQGQMLANALLAGVVSGIDNFQLARIARFAGAPKVHQAGVDLAKKLGEEVQAGDLLYRVFAKFPADLQFARHAIDKSNGYSIGTAQEVPHAFVEF